MVNSIVQEMQVREISNIDRTASSDDGNGDESDGTDAVVLIVMTIAVMIIVAAVVIIVAIVMIVMIVTHTFSKLRNSYSANLLPLGTYLLIHIKA